MKFKKGDKVRIVERGLCVQEKNGGIGMVGVIKEIDKGLFGVDSNEYTNKNRGIQDLWWFYEKALKLVDGEPLAQASQFQNNTVCVRCGGELIDKQSYALNEIIKKCKECGWC